MDLGLYLKFVLALGFVLGLIGALAWLARRFGLGGRLVPNTGQARRLSVVEVMTLDARRKLVLLRPGKDMERSRDKYTVRTLQNWH